MTKQPDPIEIKVNIAGKVDDALTALGLEKGESREVWFLEDLTEGVRPPLPLLSAGVILRLRRRKNKEDSTVKLRPCRRSQLISPWDVKPAEDSDDYRVEGDWSRTRRVLAASYVADLSRAPSKAHSIAAATSRRPSLRRNGPFCPAAAPSGSR